MKRLVSLLLFFAALVPAATAVAELAGPWEGAITIMGQELKIIVRFAPGDNGWQATIDVPQQGAADLPLRNVKREGERVYFELAAGPGLAVFDGKLDAGSIAGDFTQAGIKGTFRILKAGGLADVAAQAPEPAAPRPYQAEEVTIANGPITLAGTLTMPQGQGPFPAVILITGSGTQNRDEDIFGFKLFRVIADHLTRSGIAVLRCDDRGLANPADAQAATSKDFAGDVVAQARYLIGRREIAGKRIGLLGHSEGGIIAPLAGRDHEFAFMVLMAGTAVNGRDVILDQLALIAAANGAGPEEVAQAVADQKRVFRLMGTPEGEKEIAAIVAADLRKGLDKMTPEQRQSVSDPEAFVRDHVAQQLQVLHSPWFRNFLDYDPAPALAQLKCPVLALFGGKDLQVSPGLNRPAMEKALRKGGNKEVTFKVFADANHLFQKAKTGSPSEYATLAKEFVPGFLETISSWILAKTGQTPNEGKPGQ